MTITYGLNEPLCGLCEGPHAHTALVVHVDAKLERDAVEPRRARQVPNHSCD